MKDEPEDLRSRTRRFAVSCIRFSMSLPRGEESMILRRQFLRSGTSVGAQYREACRARSNAEFISKLESAMQELDETSYWLEVLSESGVVTVQAVDRLYDEADQLMRIITTIVKNRKEV